MTRLLTAEVIVPRPVDEVFPFFADAANLERLTPAFLNFHILTPLQIDMRRGTIIEYRIRLHAFPIRWRTRIAAWEPPFRFVDEQIRGPYRLWRHEHTFHATEGGTLCRDRVEYSHWGGSLAERLVVRPNLDRIFEFRRRAILHVFDPHRSGAAPGSPSVGAARRSLGAA